MLHDYRVTLEGYSEGAFRSAEEAKKDFIRYVMEEESDGYGREWTDLICVEEFNEITKEWK